MLTQNPKNVILITLFAFLLFAGLGVTFLIIIGNNNFSIFINSIHHFSADFFFKYITYLGDGVTAFSGLSEAAAGMSRTFEESEKVTQKFFRGMVQSTKFDGISTQFKVLTNDLMALKKEAQEAGEDPLAFVGEAALKMGKGMKMLMGPELIQQVEQASKIQAEITKEQEALRQETNLKEIINIKNRIKLLQGKFKTANKDVAKVIMDQLPVTQGILDNLKSQTIVTKKEIKFMDQRKKALMGIAKNA